ncbi:MAG: ATP-binding protein [Deferrisomatales bacterium]
MDALFEQLIADFQERDLPALTPRDARLPWLPGKVDALVGMRRSGKTWRLYQAVAERVAQGVPKEAHLYVNFEDERLLPLDAAALGRLVEVYYRRYPEMRRRECTFLLDEVQNVAGWERVVRRLVDSEQVHVCVTGSSSRLLSQEIATALRGRSLATEILPFGFREVLTHQGVESEVAPRPGSRQRSLLENRLRSYLVEGGFPEIQGWAAEDRRRVLQDYLDVAILRDVVERHEVRSVPPLRALTRHLVHSPGALFSVHKFHNALRSTGVAVGKNTLHEYLAYLQDAFLFFAVEIHSPSERARMVNPRKIYPVDPGLARACSGKVQPDWGHLLETAVYLEVRRRGGRADYYRTAGGREVDFVVTARDGRRELLQVCADPSDPGTREREVAALAEAAQELGLPGGTVVTEAQEASWDAGGCSVEVVPAWRWLLLRGERAEDPG